MFDALRKLRLQFLTNPAFRSKAQKIPLIQRVANRSAERLFALCSGFVQSQALLAFVQARLPEELLPGARSTAELASATDMPIASMRALLRAATALELCAQTGPDQYELGELGAVLIGNPGVVAMIRHHDALYADLARPLELLTAQSTRGHLQKYWAYADATQAEQLDQSAVTAYTQLMASSQQAVSEQVLAAIDLGHCRHLLDVGGGNASFAVAAVRKWPRLRVTVADLPPVAAAAQQHIAELGLDDRIDAVGIDFKREPLPQGHDALSFIRILHDHNDPDVGQLLGAAATSLPDNGLLLIAEPLAESTSTGRLLEAYFSLYLLAMGQGRLRSFGELQGMLNDAGFRPVHRARTAIPLISSALSARRSAKA